MGRVGGTLVVREVNGASWSVDAPLLIHTQGHDITVPVGFVTDFASVPRAFWSIFPPYGKYTKAAVVHDFLYRTTDHDLTRKQADRIFLEVMVGGGTAVWRAVVMYRFVRWFGGRAWRKG